MFGFPRPGSQRIWIRFPMTLALATIQGLCFGALASDDSTTKSRTVYATTPILEPDRCATAWTILRYLDPDAKLEFHERDQIPSDAILFDLPDAILKRDARRATVEVLVEQEAIKDSIVLRLAGIIHDIEINSWASRRVDGSMIFQQTMAERIYSVSNIDSSLAICVCMLDMFRQVGGDIDLWVLAQDSCSTEP